MEARAGEARAGRQPCAEKRAWEAGAAHTGAGQLEGRWWLVDSYSRGNNTYGSSAAWGKG